MLNDTDTGSVGSSQSSLDLFSLVTDPQAEGNIPNQTSSLVHNKANESSSSPSRNADASAAVDRGTLILEGEEQTNSKRSENTSSEEEKFTVPESVFLPSEIGTLEGQSSSSNNEEDNVEQEGKKSRNSYIPKHLFAHGVATFVVVVGMLILTTWRSLAWKSEALHLKEVVRLQSLHHSSLDLKIASLKADLAAWNRRHHKDPHNWKFEKGHWEIEDDDDNIVFSFKNCYFEASIGMGECSKKWQDWLLGPESEGGAAYATDEYATDEDGFTEDMNRLVGGIIDGVTAATSNSLSFVEKTMKQMSQFYIEEDFNSSDTYSWSENEISKALSNAKKVAESTVGEATTLLI